MRKEDTIINYRPKLAEELQRIMNDTLQMYEQNQIAMFYIMLEKVRRENGDIEGEKLLSNAAKCLLKDDIFCYERFERDYRHNLNKLEYGLGDVTEPSAARVTFDIYKQLVEKEKEKLDMDDFTKQEVYMVDHFFNMLLAPTRNPNIQIQEGHHKCYYDEHMDAFFSSDMKRSIEYIKKDCENTLDIFNTPDEELDKESDIEM